MENMMAHFARLDEKNKVIEVLVVDNGKIFNLPFPESEALGINYLTSIFPDTIWKQTSYNNSFRVRYAGIDYTFHPDHGENGGFAPPKEADYFVWSENECRWLPPIPYPGDGIGYYWNFEEMKWSPVVQRAPQTVVIG